MQNITQPQRVNLAYNQEDKVASQKLMEHWWKYITLREVLLSLSKFFVIIQLP